MSTKTLYFYPNLPEIQRLKVGYPHQKIVQLHSWNYCDKLINSAFSNTAKKTKVAKNEISPRKYSWLLQKFVLEISGADDYAIYNYGFYGSDALFYDEGSQLWAFMSQAFLVKSIKFLCSSDWKFPEVFKTHPTFNFRPLSWIVMAILTLMTLFFGTPCIHWDQRDRSQPKPIRAQVRENWQTRSKHCLVWSCS